MVVMDDERFVHKRKSLPRALRGHRVGLPRDRAPRGGVFGARRRGGEGEEGEEEGEAFHGEVVQWRFAPKWRLRRLS